MTDWIISWGTKVFRPRISSAASALAKHQAQLRRKSERERLIATTRKLRDELGLGDDPRLVR